MDVFINFSDWYFYIFIVLWMVVLFLGLRYFYKIEKLFKLKDDFKSGSKVAVSLMITSFIFGFLIYLIWVLVPGFGQSITLEFIFYTVILLLLLWHVFVCFTHYETLSAIIRMFLIPVLMVVYFYSAWFSGLLLIGIFSLVVIYYTLRWLKNTFA